MASTQNPSEPPFPRAWWKSAVVYQIYPASFLDSNGDGIGDLNGIHAKLDYLKDLGVDVLWLCPIYRSPQADMGYDISDYRDIDPRYGSLADWDRLLQGVHERGMKLIMDLVVNHTSDQHEWFQQSKSSKDDPKRDWYIWRPPRYVDGQRLPPNNWKSVFQGSAWEFDPGTKEYYLHLYVREQPDLNWDNPVVRDAVWDVMRFWIDRGCDGFRMDVINIISKTPGLPDAPVVDHTQYYQPASMYFANGPHVHEYIQQMYREVLSRHDLMTVGETPFTHDCLCARSELDMVFHFELMDLDSPAESPLVKKAWQLAELKAVVGRWQTYKRDEGFWNAVFIENHDHARAVSRFGNDSPAWRAISAKLLAVLEVTQTGTVYVYQGQELGMMNFPRTWGVEEYKDVASQNYWQLVKGQRQEEQGREDVDMEDVLDGFQQKARDHARIPMQWDATAHAGFTTGTPWMRAYEDDARAGWNATDESKVTSDESVLAFWKRALAVRKAHDDVLTYGDFEMRLEAHESAFAYVRTLGRTRAVGGLPGRDGCQLVLCNYGEVSVSGPGLDANVGVGEGETTLALRGYEARVYVG
ncbi:glycoside hydrolase family 13 protein [Boletus coccyginus]|nr:glycoside hydrolase family 13 protein [Boletus coccyginus]